MENDWKGVSDPTQPQGSNQMGGRQGAEAAEVVDQMGLNGPSYDFIFLLLIQKVTRC